MKKLFLSVVLAISCFAVVGCDKGKYEIALVTDVGNIDDKSFNEGAWHGVEEYAKANNKSYSYYKPTEDTKTARIDSIETAIEKGAKVVVCPGYLFEEAIYDVQKVHPETAFILLDGQPNKVLETGQPSTYETASNVHCILYQEEQAGYFAGYAAVSEGYRNLGFIGGISVPAVIRFGYGYVQGADAAAKALSLEDGAVSIKYNYAGSFAPSDTLKTKMTGWYNDGTEVVFACGGGIYLSVIGAAGDVNNTSSVKKVAIGVDTDQASVSELFITSAEKKLTQSVKLALGSFYDNGKKWDDAHAGKTATLGAKDDCVGLPTATDSWRFKNYTVASYTALYNSVKSGSITVANSTTEQPTVSAKVTVNYEA